MAKYDKSGTHIIYDNYEEYILNQSTRFRPHKPFNIKKINRQGGPYKLLSKFVKSKKVKVLDVGCRNGVFLDLLIHKGYNNVQGVDLVQKCVDSCTKDGLKVIHADCQNLSLVFGDTLFDVVYSRHTLEHVIDPSKALNEFWRILKVNGICFIIIPIQKPCRNKDIKWGHAFVFTNKKQLIDLCKHKFRTLHTSFHLFGKIREFWYIGEKI